MSQSIPRVSRPVDNAVGRMCIQEFTTSCSVRSELRETCASMYPTKTIGQMDLSFEDATLPTTTSFKALRFVGTTLSSTHLDSMLHEQLTRLELKDVKIRGHNHHVNLPPHLVELTVDNCPDFMSYPIQCLMGLSCLKKLTLGTDKISEATVKALNELDVDHHLILYGHRATDAFGYLNDVRRLRSLCVHSMCHVEMKPDTDLGWPSIENDGFDDCEADLYFSLLEDDEFQRDALPSMNTLQEERLTFVEPPLNVEELAIHTLCISTQFPFYKFKNLKSLKLWAKKEIDQEVLLEVSRHMELLEVLHFGGSVTLDADALECLRRCEKLREIMISNAIIFRGGMIVLSSLPSLMKCKLRYCRCFDSVEGDDRIFFGI